MRIIKHGRDPKKAAPVRTKCQRCRTVFEFTSDEARMVPDWRDGDYMEVACPVCGHLCAKAIVVGQMA